MGAVKTGNLRDSSIDKYLLPVRVRVDYLWNKETMKNERVVYLECANGELLTGNLPLSWAHYIAACMNKRYVSRQTPAHRVSNPIAVIRIPGLPMQRSDSQVVVPDKKGALRIVDSPEYIKSIQGASILGEELFLERWCQLPIDYPVSIACVYSVNGRKDYDMAQCNAWVLDLLQRLRIIKDKTHRTVRSMDGSQFRKVSDNPCTLIIIRKMEGK